MYVIKPEEMFKNEHSPGCYMLAKLADRISVAAEGQK